MSLIYRALRQLGSEAQATPNGRSELWDGRAETALRATRPVFLWWLLAGALILATVGALLVRSDAEEAMNFAQTVTAEEPVPATVGAASRISQAAASNRFPRPSPQWIQATTPSGAIRVANIQPAAGLSVVAQATTPTLIEVASKPASGLLVTNVQAATDLALGDSSAAPALPTIDRQSAISETVPASSHAARRRSNEPPEPIRVGESAHGATLQQQRKLTQAEARERSLQMALLTAALTRAAQARDQPETERLLSDMESKAGVGSKYSLNMRGYVALVNGQYADAEELLRLVLARDRTDADAGINMAVVESETGRVKRARRRLERLALAHPDDDRIGVMLQSLPRGAADGP